MHASVFLTSRSSPALEHVSAGIDHAFLDNVRGTFGGWGLTPALVDIILWTVASACLAAGVGIIVNHLFFKRRPFVPSGQVTAPEDILRLLHTALDQRSKVEFNFSHDDQIARPLHCAMEDIRAESLVLDAGGFATVHQGWLGRRAVCYFRIVPRTGNRNPTFYSFDTEVSGVVKKRDGSTLLSLALPTRINQQQKRVHLRMEPPVECLLGLALWPEPMTKDGRAEDHVKQFGKPLLVYSEHRKQEIRIANMSAGGMRVDVPGEAKRAAKREFDVGERYLVLLKLLNPEDQTTDKLWCMARVQNRFEDFETRTLELGLKFLAVGTPTDDEDPWMNWDKVGADGIQGLGNWIQHRHLELFRSKGIV